MSLSKKKSGYIPPHLRVNNKNVVADKMENDKDPKRQPPNKENDSFTRRRQAYDPFIDNNRVSKANNPFITATEKKKYNPFTDNEAANKRFEETLAECKKIKESNLYPKLVQTKPFNADKFNEKTDKPSSDIMDSW